MRRECGFAFNSQTLWHKVTKNIYSWAMVTIVFFFCKITLTQYDIYIESIRLFVKSHIQLRCQILSDHLKAHTSKFEETYLIYFSILRSIIIRCSSCENCALEGLNWHIKEVLRLRLHADYSPCQQDSWS